MILPYFDDRAVCLLQTRKDILTWTEQWISSHRISGFWLHTAGNSLLPTTSSLTAAEGCAFQPPQLGLCDLCFLCFFFFLSCLSAEWSRCLLFDWHSILLLSLSDSFLSLFLFFFFSCKIKHVMEDGHLNGNHRRLTYQLMVFTAVTWKRFPFPMKVNFITTTKLNLAWHLSRAHLLFLLLFVGVLLRFNCGELLLRHFITLFRDKSVLQARGRETVFCKVTWNEAQFIKTAAKLSVESWKNTPNLYLEISPLQPHLEHVVLSTASSVILLPVWSLNCLRLLASCLQSHTDGYTHLHIVATCRFKSNSTYSFGGKNFWKQVETHLYSLFCWVCIATRNREGRTGPVYTHHSIYFVYQLHSVLVHFPNLEVASLRNHL